jgi:hypothetical protein
MVLLDCLYPFRLDKTFLDRCLEPFLTLSVLDLAIFNWWYLRLNNTFIHEYHCSQISLYFIGLTKKTRCLLSYKVIETKRFHAPQNQVNSSFLNKRKGKTGHIAKGYRLTIMNNRIVVLESYYGFNSCSNSFWAGTTNQVRHLTEIGRDLSHALSS